MNMMKFQTQKDVGTIQEYHDIHYHLNSAVQQVNKTPLQENNKLLPNSECHETCQESGLCKEVLDLYLPSGDEKGSRNEDGSTQTTTPLVVFVHGGAWRRGHSKSWKHFMSSRDTNLLFCIMKWFFGLHDNVAESLAHKGYACASVSYPLGRARPLLAIIEFLLSSFMSFVVLTLPNSIIASICAVTLSSYTPYSTMNDIIIIFTSILLTINNISLFILITCIFYQNYEASIRSKIISSACLLSSLALAAVLVYIGVSLTFSLAIFCICVTVVVNVFIIVDQWLSLRRALFPDNLKAVLNSVAWLQSYGRSTGAFNPNSVILMGHSAGAHLVMTSAVHGSYLEEAGIDRNSIKGIIGVSGVYNLMNLSGMILRHLYLLPSFAAEPATWRRASPVHIIQDAEEDNRLADPTSPHSCSTDHWEESEEVLARSPLTEVHLWDDENCTSIENLPPVLLVNAEHDFHLAKDTKEISQLLSARGVSVTCESITGTTHRNILYQFRHGTKLSKCFNGSRTDLQNICCEFISRL